MHKYSWIEVPNLQTLKLNLKNTFEVKFVQPILYSIQYFSEEISREKRIIGTLQSLQLDVH